MRHELVHRLTHFGHRHLPALPPDRGRLGRVSELAQLALRSVVVATILLAAPLIAALLATALAIGAAGLPAYPLAGWLVMVVVTAAMPSLARRAHAIEWFRS